MRFQVGVYRTVTHCQTIIVDAESNDAAYELAAQGMSANVMDKRNIPWKHQRTEFRVSYVQKDWEYRPPAGSCNDGVSVDAGGEDSCLGVAGDSEQLPGFE